MNKIILISIIVLVIILIAVGVFVKLKLNNSNTTMIQGMKIEVERQGSGAGAAMGDNVTVNYSGTLASNSKEFDSSYKRNMPFPFQLGMRKVIKGWDLGLIGMKVGEKRKLTIPPALAYGSTGVGGIIPPNATLIFEVEMLGIAK